MFLPDSGPRIEIQLNGETQCYEAWVIYPDTGERALLATCSACVSPAELDWWEQQVRTEWAVGCQVETAR